MGGSGPGSEFPGAVGLGELEVVVVEVVVVAGAEQGEVGDVGRPALFPELDVMGFAVGGVGAADDAALVAVDECHPLFIGGGAGSASDPEWVACRVDDER